MKKIYLFIVTLSACLMGGQGAWAQEKPFWTEGYFADAENSYIEVASATDYDLPTARQKAYDEVKKRRSMATGTNVQVTTSMNTSSVESSHNLIVKARVIDEYVERTPGAPYKVYLLVQTAKNPTYEYEDVTVTRKYPFSARALVPGWQQIYKGSKTKGALIIAAEAVGVAGIVTSFSMKASYEKFMQEDSKNMATYSESADMWQNIGWGCIAFTAAVYLCNIIDAAAAPGKEHIIVRKNKRSMAFMPVVSPDGSMGFAARINF